MPSHNEPVVNVNGIARAFAEYRFRWIIPAAALTALALAFAVLKPAEWQASQALLVRDEAAGAPSRPGQFGEPALMKQAQETVLELAKSRAVVAAALVEVGSPDGVIHSWPSSEDIEDARKAISLSAPNGAAFGTTEVFYLKVKDHDRLRSVALTNAVCRQLDERFRELRRAKAESLVMELEDSEKLAQADLDDATTRLRKLEQQLGPDLAELRLLNETSSGESNLRRVLVEIKNELRAIRAGNLANQHLLKVLDEARQDTAALVATPGRLLDAQPALRRLKDGLVDAQILTAKLLGEMTQQHPKVQSAVAAQQQIRHSLHGELEIAIRSLNIDLELGEARADALEVQLDEVQQRMDNVVRMRADYGNLVDEVHRRGETLAAVQQKLSAARANRAAADTASLITRIDRPVVGDHPLGPRKALIVAAGLFGGLFAGCGLLLLTAPIGLFEYRPMPNPIAAPSPQQNGHDGAAAQSGLSLKEALARLTGGSFSRN